MFRDIPTTDCVTHKLLGLPLVIDLNHWLPSLINHLESPMFHISLNLCISEFPSNQSFCVENGVVRVHGDLILCGISDKTFVIVEGDVGGGGSVTLIVGDDFDSVGTEGVGKKGKCRRGKGMRNVSIVRISCATRRISLREYYSTICRDPSFRSTLTCLV